MSTEAPCSCAASAAQNAALPAPTTMRSYSCIYGSRCFRSVARMERSAMREQPDPGLRFAPSGLQRQLSDRRRGGDQGGSGLLEAHRASQVGDAGEAALGAPRFEALDDRDHAGWV